MKKRSDNLFEKAVEDTDFGSLIEKVEIIPGRVGRKKIGTKIAIILPDEILQELKSLAEKKAIGYQTLIRIIVLEKLEEDRHKKSA